MVCGERKKVKERVVELKVGESKEFLLERIKTFYDQEERKKQTKKSQVKKNKRRKERESTSREGNEKIKE